MALNEVYLQYVLNQLCGLEGITTNRMFGGVGFFKDKVMFAKIGGNTFRLKVGNSKKKQFEERGMAPFYNPNKKKGMPYWEVPKDIVEDASKLVKWAKQSIEIAKSKKT